MDDNVKKAYEQYIREDNKLKKDKIVLYNNENDAKKGCKILLEMIRLRAILLKNPNMTTFNIRHTYAQVFYWNGIYIMKDDTIICLNNNKTYKAPSTFVSDHKKHMASLGIYRGDNTKIQSNGWIEAKILIDNERFNLNIYRYLQMYKCI